LVGLGKWGTLSDPHYWDALGCYVFQGRFIATHGAHFGAYRELGFVRPPLYTSLLAGFIATGHGGREVLHLLSWALGVLVLGATYLLSRRLGAGPRTAWTAVLLCALSPLFFAQTGLAQSDLLATLLCTTAFALLLGGSTAGYLVFACLGVLTKESAYFICAPASLWLLWRAQEARDGQASLRFWHWRGQGAAVRRALPALVPCAVLFLWEVLHRVVIGEVMHPAYRAAIGPNHLDAAIIHEFIEGGRLPLSMLAALPVVGLLRPRTLGRFGLSPAALGARQRLGVLAAAAGVLVLPFLFPAPLPRYMLLSLPLLCALSALGLSQLPVRARAAALLFLSAILILGWRGQSWHTNGGHHLDANLAYRRLLTLQTQAARALFQEHPRGVLATFPMVLVVRAPPDDGFLPAPLPASVVRNDETLAQLCRSDFLIEDSQGLPVTGAMAVLRQAGALVPWRTFSNGDDIIRVHRVRCP
jgi:4-amino-4-deoxy-L-arabinose transferase-like glycosyltransferase